MAFKEFDGDLDGEQTPSTFTEFNGELDEPTTTWQQDVKLGLANLGNMVDKGGTLAASNFVPEETANNMFKSMDERIKARDQFADTDGRKQGFGGKVISTLATLPSQVIAAPLSAIDTAVKMIDNGETLDKAYKAAGVDAALTTVGFALPAGFGKTLLQKALTGGGANAAQDYLSKWLISNKIAGTEKSKKEFEPTLEDAAVSGLVGGGFGAMHGMGTRRAPDITERPNIDPNATPTKFKEFDGKLDAAPVQDISTVANADDFATINPYDVAGLVSEAQAGRPFEVDQPQGNLFGGTEEGSVRQPRVEDVNPDALLNEQHKANQVPFDGPGLQEPSFDNGVRNIDPDTGARVQGMDESVPTVDFPLRTEVLDADPRVAELREQIGAMEQGENQSTQVKDSTDYLKEAFAEHLDKGYGIKEPQDAYGPLFESGKGTTKLPIKKGFAPMGGKFNRQKGSLNTKEIKEGVNLLKERFQRAGIKGPVAEMVAEGSVKNQPKPTIYNDAARTLLDSKAGKGLADFTMMDLSPETVIEAAKSFEDIKRAPIQEHIENGGLFRTLATKNPIVKFTTERLIRAQQHADRVVRDNLLAKDTGLKSVMREMNDAEKADIWSLQMLAEGEKVFSPAELAERGFNNKQIKYYERAREIDDNFYETFNAQREKLGLAPMDRRTAHIAGRFAGDFFTIAERVKLDEAGNPIVKADGSLEKEIIGRIGGRTKWEHNRALNFMKEKHPDWSFGEPQYKKLGGGNTAGARFNGFMEAVNLLGKEEGNVKELVDAYRELMKSDSSKYLNAMRHAKDKKASPGGIVGSEGHKAWLDETANAQDGMKSQLDYFEQGYHWIEMQKATEDISKVLSNPEISANMPNAVGWANMHLDHVMGRNGGFLADATNELISKIGQASGIGHTKLLNGANNVKHFMMQKFMGFANIPFTIAQLVQPLQSLPPMALLMKNRGVEFSGFKAGAEASMTMMKVGLDRVFGEGKSDLSSFEKEALDYAHQHEVFDVKMVDHTRNINASKAKDTFDKLADFNIQQSEALTRGTAFLFYAHALKDTGMPMKDILSTAENMTRMSMVDYTPSARPAMYDKMGFIGDMASTLARFKHGQVNNLIAYSREVGRGKGGISSAAPLASFLVAQIAFGGLMGVLGYQVADELVRQISSKVFKEPTSLTDIILSAKNIPEWISHGVFAAGDIDMSSRFSSGTVLPESPGEFLLPYGTGMWEMAQAGYGLAKNPNEFNAKRAALAFAPSSARGLLEGQLFTTKNPKTGLNDVINPRTMEGAYKRSDKEVMMRNFGFRSMNESKTSAKLYEQKYGKDQPREDARKSLLDNFMSDFLSDNLTKQDFKKASQEYAKLGSDKFDRDLTQRVKAMNLTPEQRYLMRNLSSNYAGAYRLKQYLNTGE